MNEIKNNKRQRTESGENELNAAKLLRQLEQSDELYELHTHLLGMGNAAFWIHSILTDQTKLPTQDDFINSESIRNSLGPLFWDKRNHDFINQTTARKFFDKLRGGQEMETLCAASKYAMFHNLLSAKLLQEINHHKLTYKDNFSYDVIFSLENLAKGLGLKENQPRDTIQAIIEEKLGVYTVTDWQDSKIFREWIIFNARDQALEVVYGVQAERLRMLIGGAKPTQLLTDPAQRDARAHIINAFSMMNADGTEPRSIDYHSFRGAFTPEFYPRRFALKDSIYSQRLDLLAFLLLNALRRFSTCLPRVTYCEFSIGCGDLTRPWMFDVLTTFSQHEKYSGGFRRRANGGDFPWLEIRSHQGIDYRFLAGFNRRVARISNGYSADEAVTLLFEAPHLAIHIMLTEFYKSEHERPTSLFVEQVQQLRQLSNAAVKHPHFFRWVVGLDLFGDELGYPYCAFVAHEFVRFIQDSRKANPAFGVRIHCAENVPFIRPDLPGYRLFTAHMYIIYRCLDFLKKKLLNNIRVGHGIVFDKLLAVRNYKFRKSSVLTAEIQQNAKSLLSSIPFEVNITSNFYLLGDAIRNVDRTKPLSNLYKIGVPIILSTDDDGIWPIDKCMVSHQSHHSLAAEYCRAITTRFITKETQLQEIVENAKRFCFDGSKPASRNNVLSTTSNKGRTATSYFPTDVIVHPNLIRILMKKAESNNIPTGPCLQYYGERFRMESVDENNDLDGKSSEQYEPMAPFAVACFYVIHSLGYEKFAVEYKQLFGASIDTCQKFYKLCEAVQIQLMKDTPGQGASMQIRVGQQKYLFCSEAPDNRNRFPLFLFSTIEKFIARKFKSKATVMGFMSTCDFQNPEIKSYLENIEKKIRDKRIDILIYTNTEKKSVFLENSRTGQLFINTRPEQRTDPKQETNEAFLYAVCPHGSVATTVLQFIARNFAEKIKVTPQHVFLRELIVPFFPLHFSYPVASEQESEQEHRSRFVTQYSIIGTKLAKIIKVQKNTVCRCCYDGELNLLHSDVKYAEQIDTKNLLEKIPISDKKFLEILKATVRFNTKI